MKIVATFARPCVHYNATNTQTDMKSLYKEVNQHFLIRYFSDSATHDDKLVTARQCHELIGDDDLFTRTVDRALCSPKEKEVVKLRRGIKFVFVSR